MFIFYEREWKKEKHIHRKSERETRTKKKGSKRMGKVGDDVKGREMRGERERKEARNV